MCDRRRTLTPPLVRGLPVRIWYYYIYIYYIKDIRDDRPCPDLPLRVWPPIRNFIYYYYIFVRGACARTFFIFNVRTTFKILDRLCSTTDLRGFFLSRL